MQKGQNEMGLLRSHGNLSGKCRVQLSDDYVSKPPNHKYFKRLSTMGRFMPKTLEFSRPRNAHDCRQSEKSLGK